MQIAYPSDGLPAPTAFVIEAPDDWSIHDSTEAVVVLLAPPESCPDYRVNAVVTLDRVGSEASLDEIAETAFDGLVERHGDVRLIGKERGDVESGEVLVRTVEFVVGEPGVQVVQMQAFVPGPLGDGRSVRDLYQVLGTCRSDQVEQWSRALSGIVESFSLVLTQAGAAVGSSVPG